MDFFTLDIAVFGLTISNFILAALIIILALIVSGIILLVRNIRPILGFLLLVFALALIIGISYDAPGIERELTKFWSKVEAPEATQTVDDSAE